MKKRPLNRAHADLPKTAYLHRHKLSEEAKDHVFALECLAEDVKRREDARQKLEDMHLFPDYENLPLGGNR